MHAFVRQGFVPILEIIAHRVREVDFFHQDLVHVGEILKITNARGMLPYSTSYCRSSLALKRCIMGAGHNSFELCEAQ